MVGFCLDTCHAHAGGNALETVVDDVRRITGRIDLVHCNDSRDEFDSGADRHANLGAGRIDPDLLAAVVRDAGAPVVCETPGWSPTSTAPTSPGSASGSEPRSPVASGTVLTVRAISESEHLDFVRRQRSASFLQTPAWGQVKTEWRRESLGWFRDDELVGAALVLYRQLPQVKRYLAYLPEGPVIDWESDDLGRVARRRWPPTSSGQGAFGVRMGPPVVTRRWTRRPGQGGHRRRRRAPPRRGAAAGAQPPPAPAWSPSCTSSAGGRRRPRAASPPASRSTSSGSRWPTAPRTTSSRA